MVGFGLGPVEIKIICDCGQMFKFDAEHVDGRMPWEVNCPVCGASVTDKANYIIRHWLAGAVAAPEVPAAATTVEINRGRPKSQAIQPRLRRCPNP